MEARDTYIMESKNKHMALTCHDYLSRELWVDALISEQAEISYKVGGEEGFVKGYKAGIKEGIDEGIQRVELFMQRNLPINVDLNPKWQAQLKEWDINP